MSDGLHIPEHLWEALEQMEQEMGVPKNNLVCQAIFTLARLNGYVVAGQVSLPHAVSEPAPPQTSASGREKALPLSSAPPKTPSAPPEEEALEKFSEDTPPRPLSAYAPSREETPSSGRRRNLSSAPLLSRYEKEETPPEEFSEEELAHSAYAQTEAEVEVETEAQPETQPPSLFIEIPGEEAVPVEGDEFIIGRGKTCNFVIDSNRVSRQHARIFREGDNFILEDLNSSNGTFYGKHREKITRRVIADRDEFVLGTERVTFYIQ